MYFEYLVSPFPIMGLCGALLVFIGIFSVVSWIMPPPYLIQPLPVKFYIGVAITSLIIHITYLLGTAIDPDLLALTLLLTGFIYLVANIKIFSKFRKKSTFLFKGFGPILFIYIGIFFLFSLSPITDGDTIAYHAPVAVESYKNGAYPNQPLWFSTRLSGSIESFATIFVALRFEQFGHLLNFFGLLGILWGFYRPDTIFDNVNHEGLIEKTTFFGCIFVISPILMQLIVSWKPSLFVIFGLLCVTILIKNLMDNTSEATGSNFIWSSIIGIVLASTVFMRISYILPAFLIILFFFSINLKNMTTLKFQTFMYIGISFLVLSTLVIFVQARALNLEFSELLLNPFVSTVSGGDSFRSYLKSYSATGLIFPFSIFFAATSGEVTSVVSLAYFFILIYSINIMTKNRHLFGILFILICSTLYFLFLPNNARFWLEIFVGVFIYACAYGSLRFGCQVKRVLLGLFSLPAIPILALGLYYGFGFLSTEHKLSILERHAFGYAEAVRINKYVGSDDVIYSFNRPMLFLNGTVVSNEWDRFLSSNQEREVALRLVESYEVDYVLDTWSVSEGPRYCLGKPLVGPFQVRYASRNPLTVKPTYNVGVFDAKHLEGCF